MTYTEDARGIQEDLVRLRRDLHRIPEIGLELPRTQELVLGALDGLPLEISTGESLRSVTAVLRGTKAANGAPKEAVLLRGDMDALPLVEKTGRDFGLSRPGDTMHACGHDLHTSMLVGAARPLERAPGHGSTATWCSCSSPARRARTARAAHDRRGRAGTRPARGSSAPTACT